MGHNGLPLAHHDLVLEGGLEQGVRRLGAIKLMPERFDCNLPQLPAIRSGGIIKVDKRGCHGGVGKRELISESVELDLDVLGTEGLTLTPSLFDLI